MALVPCFTVYYLALSIKKKKWRQFVLKEKTAFVILFLFWLFMFPNTAYLFFTVRHLVNYCFDFDSNRVCMEGATWMVIFFFTYALIGLPTFYYALKKMKDVFSVVFNKISGKILPVLIIPLTSIAIMFGLFERLNSWDILKKPWFLFETAFSYFINQIDFFNFLIFTFCLYLIYYGFDIFIWKILRKK